MDNYILGVSVDDIANISGMMTFLISIFNSGLFLTHFFFFLKSSKKMAKRIRLVFLSDVLMYAITCAFGAWAYFQWSFEVAIYIHLVRIPILLLNACAAYRLFRYYKARI